LVEVRQPGQRPGDLVDVLDPPVDDSSVIIAACEVRGCESVERFSDRIGAGSGQQYLAA